MRRATISLLLLVTAVSGTVLAQTQSSSRPAQKPDADRLGMTCAQVLKMSSTEWVVNFNDKSQVAAPDASVGAARAIAVFGKCYDTRTDALAASLAKNGRGPSKAARADFAGFEAALKDFAAKALTDATVPADEAKKAYVALYEKQFRYQFYQEYEAKTLRPAKPAAPATKPSTSAAAPSTAPSSAASSAGPARPATAQEQARSNADPVTMAKNRFGKLLEVLPDDKMHELHRAFGDVIGPHTISEPMRLAVYRYAIFILEPPSATPFAPPPF
jgi:hypothetical protein